MNLKRWIGKIGKDPELGDTMSVIDLSELPPGLVTQLLQAAQRHRFAFDEASAERVLAEKLTQFAFSYLRFGNGPVGGWRSLERVIVSRPRSIALEAGRVNHLVMVWAAILLVERFRGITLDDNLDRLKWVLVSFLNEMGCVLSEEAQLSLSVFSAWMHEQEWLILLLGDRGEVVNAEEPPSLFDQLVSLERGCTTA